MITKQDLQEAIAECQGVKNPNANTCLKLASYYTIMDHTRDDNNNSYRVNSSYSFSNNDEFMQSIEDIPVDKVYSIMDELMDTIKILHPKLYNSVIHKFHN